MTTPTKKRARRVRVDAIRDLVEKCENVAVELYVEYSSIVGKDCGPVHEAFSKKIERVLKKTREEFTKTFDEDDHEALSCLHARIVYTTKAKTVKMSCVLKYKAFVDCFRNASDMLTIRYGVPPAKLPRPTIVLASY